MYVTQQPQLRAVMLVLDQYFTGLPEVVDYLLAPLATLACSLLVALAWRRLSPRTFRVVSGGRAGGRPGARAGRRARAAGRPEQAGTPAAGAAATFEPASAGRNAVS